VPKTKIELAVDDASSSRSLKHLQHRAHRQDRRRQVFVAPLDSCHRIRPGNRSEAL